MNTRTFARWLAGCFLALFLAEQAAHAFYDPSLGRWPNRDPLNELGFRAMTGSKGSVNRDEDKNLYLFVRNNPISYYDPYGNSAVGVCLPIAGGCAVADGPLPIGDIIAGGILIGAVAWDVCFTTRTYTCRVFCPLIATGGNNNAEVGTVQATGTGKTYAEACRNAERAARNAAPPGTRTKHCQWR